MTESQYQSKLIKKIKNLLPGCVVLKNDAGYIQGIPDLLVLYNTKWAALEIKLSDTSNIQPNQEYYLNLLDDMSFASFVNPQNEEEVLYDLQYSLGVKRNSRVS
jgi:hypothetical protein